MLRLELLFHKRLMLRRVPDLLLRHLLVLWRFLRRKLLLSLLQLLLLPLYPLQLPLQLQLLLVQFFLHGLGLRASDPLLLRLHDGRCFLGRLLQRLLNWLLQRLLNLRLLHDWLLARLLH